MGVFHAIEDMASAITTNFSAKITEVSGEESKALDSTFKLYKRERAETIIKKTLPGVGVWARNGSRTGWGRQKLRDWQVPLVIDYLFRGGDRTKVAEQIELALDAMFRVIDGLPTTKTWGAAEERFGTTVTHDLDDLIQESAGSVTPLSPFVGGFRIELPVQERDVLP